MSSKTRGLSISVMLAVTDAPKATEWYKTALGAKELWNLGSVVELEIASPISSLAQTSPSSVD